MTLLKQLSAVATACAVFLSVGFGIGTFLGYKGPLLHADMTNSTINASLSSYDSHLPCFPDSNGGSTCIFDNGTTFWKCQNWWANQSHWKCDQFSGTSPAYDPSGNLLPYAQKGDHGCAADYCYKNDTYCQGEYCKK